LLRMLRLVDPMSIRDPYKYPLPRGMSLVTELQCELMEADALNSLGPPVREADGASGSAAGGAASQGGPAATDADGRSAKDVPRHRPVLDPLEELCRRLRRGWFSSVARLTLTNVEDHRLDYHFLSLRTTVFGKFAHFRAAFRDGRYTITADCGPEAPSAEALQTHDVGAVLQANSDRVPQGAELLLTPADKLSQAEAAFLVENPQAFKGADSFHYRHAPWRSTDGEVVRQRYQDLFDAWQMGNTTGAIGCNPGNDITFQKDWPRLPPGAQPPQRRAAP